MRNRYCQCELKQQKTGEHEISWIPEKFAVKGKILTLGVIRGWEVINVYESKDFSELELKERDYLRQRKSSDI